MNDSPQNFNYYDTTILSTIIEYDKVEVILTFFMTYVENFIDENIVNNWKSLKFSKYLNLPVENFIWHKFCSMPSSEYK